MKSRGEKEIDNIFKQFNMFILTTGTCSQSYNKITSLKALFTHGTMIKVLYIYNNTAQQNIYAVTKEQLP